MRHLLIACLLCGGLTAIAAPRAEAPPVRSAAGKAKSQKHPQRQVGKASIYARKFAGRKMANGERMDPQDDNAASKTLPLGTKARVKNLETGQSTVVTIEDRGPHVPGRVVDLSPASAAQIGLDRKEGLAKVEVTPLSTPPGKASP